MGTVNDPAVKAFDEFREQIAAYSAKVFDYDDPQGNKAARSYLHELRKVKGALESRRKERKAASLAYGRSVDSEAKEIEASIDAMIEVHAKPLREIADREIARKKALMDRLEWFKSATATHDEDGEPFGSNYLGDMLERVRSAPLDDSWSEMLGQAVIAKGTAAIALQRHVYAAEKREREAAELQRLREQQAEAEKVAAQRKVQQEAEERVRADLERKANAEREAAARATQKAKEDHDKAIHDAEESASRERAEAARVLRETEAAAKLRETEIRLETERKERARLDAENAERTKREARERDEQNRAKVHDEIAAYLIKRGVTAKQATIVVGEMAGGSIPHVSINY